MSPSPPSSPSSSIPTAVALTVAASDDPRSSAAVSLATIASLSPIAALPAPNPSSTTKRGLPPPCWSNEETLALIDSYREKWYSLRRGNLRAAHWDEVAAAVARRSLHLPGATPKTSVQCRHKIEKLRKRYRSERQRSLAHDPTCPPSSPWIFFKKMDLMENPNPTPIPNPNPNPNPPSHLNNHYRRYQESDDDNDEEMEPMFHRRPQVIANGNGSGSGGSLKFKIPKAVRTSRAVPLVSPSPTSYRPNSSSFSNKEFVKPGLDEMRRRFEAKRQREEEEDDDDEKGSDAMGEMVRALRMLGDGYIRTEQMKMDMTREMERARMEMELKRTEMILDMQRRILDSFVKGVIREKKSKRSPDS